MEWRSNGPRAHHPFRQPGRRMCVPPQSRRAARPDPQPGRTRLPSGGGRSHPVHSQSAGTGTFVAAVPAAPFPPSHRRQCLVQPVEAWCHFWLNDNGVRDRSMRHAVHRNRKRRSVRSQLSHSRPCAELPSVAHQTAGERSCSTPG